MIYADKIPNNLGDFSADQRNVEEIEKDRGWLRIF